MNRLGSVSAGQQRISSVYVFVFDVLQKHKKLTQSYCQLLIQDSNRQQTEARQYIFSVRFRDVITAKFIISHIIFTQCPNNAKEERKRKKIILHSAKIATMENTCWELVCKLQERKPGHSMYPYQNLGRLSVENGRDILLKALDQTINVSAMSKLICKLPEAADGEEMVLQRLRQRKVIITLAIMLPRLWPQKVHKNL